MLRTPITDTVRTRVTAATTEAGCATTFRHGQLCSLRQSLASSAVHYGPLCSKEEPLIPKLLTLVHSDLIEFSEWPQTYTYIGPFLIL